MSGYSGKETETILFDLRPSGTRVVEIVNTVVTSSGINGINADSDAKSSDLQGTTLLSSIPCRFENGFCSKVSPIWFFTRPRRRMDYGAGFSASVSTAANVCCTASVLGSPRRADEVVGADSTAADIDVVLGSVKSEMDVRPSSSRHDQRVVGLELPLIRSGSVWRSNGWAFRRLEVVRALRGSKKATSGGVTEPTMTAGETGLVTIGTTQNGFKAYIVRRSRFRWVSVYL